MSATLATTLADLVARLEERVAETWWPAPEAAFAAYVFATTPAAVPPSLAEAGTAIRAAALAEVDSVRWDEAPVLAAAGYVLADGADDALRERWQEGVERLAERDPFPPDRASFFYRPVELLGLARGTAGDGSFRSWLAGVLRDGERRVAADVWHHALGAAAAAAVGVRWTVTVSSVDVDRAGVEELALLCWLAVAHPEVAGELLGSEERLQPDVLERTLLERALLEQVDADDGARAAVIAAALRRATERTLESAHAARWQLDRSEHDATELIVNLCRRFPRYVLQLAARHDERAALQIDDEYDLQDSLHALLRLHFDDVREEVWTPNYGGVHKRMDFLLKREQTVVETKMTRKGLDQRKVGEELTIDKAHYRKEPDCKTLICFIYDPEHRLTNPDALEGDLSDEDGGLMTRVVVAPRPS